MKYSDIEAEPSPWYSVKSIFRDEENSLYEERIVLFKATNADEALDLAHKEAEEYAHNVGVHYAGYSEVFHLLDNVIENGAELSSTMRKSELTPETYIKQFIATGDEIGIEREEV